MDHSPSIASALPQLSSFGHHPNPAVDFCLEVDTLEAELTDQRAGLAPEFDLARRIARAMLFRVGGDARAVSAKARLRELEAETSPAAQAA